MPACTAITMLLLVNYLLTFPVNVSTSRLVEVDCDVDDKAVIGGGCNKVKQLLLTSC